MISFPSLAPLKPIVSEGSTTDASSSFQSLLLDAFQQTNAQGQAAEMSIHEALGGGEITQVEVATALKKADLSLRMMLQVRNKLIDAYNEIRQMQV
ncbi:MAG: flagellar hook-basal body complex protein FliE [Planctomycetaceae bacterium]